MTDVNIFLESLDPDQIKTLPLSELQKIGEATRTYYLEQKQKFHERLAHLLTRALELSITEWQESFP